MKKINNKAFTLIEILAVVVILGIISTVAIVGVSSLINKAKENHYKTQNENVILAAKSYFDNNTNDMPKNIGQSKTISLEVLQDNNYIKDVKDYGKNDCDKEKSYVKIFKYSKKDYSYAVYLSCPNYKSDATSTEMKGPDITITQVSEKIKIEINETADDRILSYSYIVYKYISTSPVEIINSGNKSADLKSNIVNNIKLGNNLPGEFKVEVTATDIYGNVSTTTKKLTVNDMNAPDCGDNVEGESTVWAAGTRKIRVYCSDSGSGCTQSYYEKTFTGNIKEGTITIEDKSGKTTECPVDVYLDNEPPKCTVKANGTKGDNNWYITNVNLSLTSDDNGGSGVASYGMGTSTTASYNSLNSQIQNSNTSGTTWYGYAKDAVGNTTICNSGNIKVDKTKPTCSISKDGTEGENGWYKSNVSLSLNKNDTGGSGIAGYGMGTSSTASYNSSTTKTQSSNTSGTTWYGYVKDGAGNTAKCNTGAIKKDDTAPTCSISKEGTEGKNSWYTTNVKLSLTKNDTGGSGIAGYGMGTSSTASYNSSTTKTQSSNTTGTTWYGYVKDAAGNTATCNSGNIKKDSTAPQLTLTMKKLGKTKVDSSKTIKTYYGSYSNYSSGSSYDGTVLVWTNPSDSTSGVASTVCTVSGADASRNSNSFANWRGVYLKGTTNVSCYSLDNAGNKSSTVTASIVNNHTHVYGNSIGAVSAAYKNYRVANYDWDTAGATKNWQDQSCSCSTHKFNSSKKGALVQCIHCGRTVVENGGNKGTWWCPAAARALGLDVFG